MNKYFEFVLVCMAEILQNWTKSFSLSDMPLHRLPLSLLEQASLQLSKLFLRIITDIERRKGLHNYISILPPLVVEQIINTAIELYVKITKSECASHGISILDAVQHGTT